MSGLKKYRWLILIFVWAGALFFSYMNSGTIQEIVSQRSKIESLRSDREFWQRNSGNAVRVMSLQKSMSQEIESLKLAQVALIDKLKNFMGSAGISDIRIEPDSKSSEETGTPIGISFKGTSKNGMEVISRMQRDFPYLSLQKISMSPEGNMGLVKFDTTVNYRYRLVSNEMTSTTGQ